MTRSSNKLNHVKIRSFKIIRNIKNISFELKLSEGMWWKHSVFHIFLLKSASLKVSILTQVSENYLINKKDNMRLSEFYSTRTSIISDTI